MEHVGIRWIMTEITMSASWKDAGRPDSTVMMGYLTAAALVPTLFLGMIGGLVTDRVNRRTLLIITRFLMMLIAGGLALSSYLCLAEPMVLLALSALQGVAIAFDAPAAGVLTPRLVPREDLTEAMYINGMQFNLARVIGPALGGLVYSWVGATALFVINAVSFLVVIVSVMRTPDSPAPPRPDTGRPPLRQAWHDVREAIEFLAARKGPRAAFLAMFIFSVFATPMIQLLPIFVSGVYGAEERAYGILLGCMGSGAVAGGFLIKLLPKWYPNHHLIPASMMLGGLAIGLFAAMPSILPAGFFLFFAGIFWMWSFTAAYTAIQLLVTDEMRGRVLSACNTAALGAMPLGTLLAAWIGRAVGSEHDSGHSAQIGVGLCADVLVIAGVVMLMWRTPEVDGPVSEDHHPAMERGLFRGLTALEHRPGDPEASMEKAADVPNLR
jgi:MFS family permease